MRPPLEPLTSKTYPYTRSTAVLYPARLGVPSKGHQSRGIRSDTKCLKNVERYAPSGYRRAVEAAVEVCRRRSIQKQSYGSSSVAREGTGEEAPSDGRRSGAELEEIRNSFTPPFSARSDKMLGSCRVTSLWTSTPKCFTRQTYRARRSVTPSRKTNTQHATRTNRQAKRRWYSASQETKKARFAPGIHSYKDCIVQILRSLLFCFVSFDRGRECQELISQKRSSARETKQVIGW